MLNNNVTIWISNFSCCYIDQAQRSKWRTITINQVEWFQTNTKNDRKTEWVTDWDGKIENWNRKHLLFFCGLLSWNRIRDMRGRKLFDSTKQIAQLFTWLIFFWRKTIRKIWQNCQILFESLLKCAQKQIDTIYRNEYYRLKI